MLIVLFTIPTNVILISFVAKKKPEESESYQNSKEHNAN